MCIALWALDQQDYALILLSNRDELLRRPTLDAHFHNFDTKAEDGSAQGGILSGRDILAGGTWFGVTRTGKVALLSEQDTISTLAPTYLSPQSKHSPECIEEEARRILPQDAKFAGFNLLLFKPSAPQSDGRLHFDSLRVTNHGAGGEVHSRPLSAKERISGCVSNAIDGQNTNWPKVEHATIDLDAVLQTLSSDTTETVVVEQLFNVLEYVPVLPRFISRDVSDISYLQKKAGGLLNLSPSVLSFAIP
ncbi:hypothetical protein C0993_002294 [Termitomyces sp. T159_Od127]|nr:hypothetical protein C0993_002294 [Termitomyces sp. T159_Od127]